MSEAVDRDVSQPTASDEGQKRPEHEIVREVESWQSLIDAIQNRLHPRADELKETNAGRVRAMKDHQPPMLDLPGFGEELEDCGAKILRSKRFCDECGHEQDFARNCMRYDCPTHAPYAVRRRAAGSSDGVGLAPKLAALIRWLGSYFDEPFDYSHLVLRPHPDDPPIFESEEPMEAMKAIGRECMDLLGVQGVMAYHPWSGENEDPEENDIGEWRGRLPPDPMDEEKLQEKIEYKPHLHMLVVHPRNDEYGPEDRAGLDFTKVEDLEDETGWICTRIIDEDTNKSIYARNENETKEHGMVRALTYMLSHAGVYETDEQRRLAAWMKGPDVNQVGVSRYLKEKIGAMVNSEARDTLGIAPPDLSCSNQVPEELADNSERAHELSGFERISQQIREDRVLGRSDWAANGGPGISTTLSQAPNPTPASGGGSSTHVEGVGGMASAPDELPDMSEDFSSSTSSSTSSDSSESSTVGVTYDEDPDMEDCSGHYRHISQAGGYLGDPEWRANVPDDELDALEKVYYQYNRVLMKRGLEAHETRPRLPEEDPPDPPPESDGR